MTARIGRSKRKRIWRRNGKRCWYCGIKMRKKYTLDHRNPKCKGGTNEWNNLSPACEPCNQGKGDLTVEEYRTHLSKIHEITNVKFYGEGGEDGPWLRYAS